jgi:hypothetical protein
MTEGCGAEDGPGIPDPGVHKDILHIYKKKICKSIQDDQKDLIEDKDKYDF